MYTISVSSRLADLAGGGSVLELGIGTGFVALPLAERGLGVRGIDASEAMVAKLRAKPSGEGNRVFLSDPTHPYFPTTTFGSFDADGRPQMMYRTPGASTGSIGTAYERHEAREA